MILAFIHSKSAWINEKRALAQKRITSLPTRKFENGEIFLLLGSPISLKLVDGQHSSLTLEKDFLLTHKAKPDAKILFEKWYKQNAQQILAARVQLFSAKHGFQYQKIRITSAKTRWGSCSSTGTLSFTWRLVMAPVEVIDYVVIHELVHLRIKNHSSMFWAEVERLMPSYKTKQEWLKTNGQLLTLGGEQ